MSEAETTLLDALLSRLVRRHVIQAGVEHARLQNRNRAFGGRKDPLQYRRSTRDSHQLDDVRENEEGGRREERELDCRLGSHVAQVVHVAVRRRGPIIGDDEWPAGALGHLLAEQSRLELQVAE